MSTTGGGSRPLRTGRSSRHGGMLGWVDCFPPVEPSGCGPMLPSARPDGRGGAMRQDDTAVVPGDLLLHAVEGMDRPMLVLDGDWRFAYVNPSGARALARSV